LGLLPLLRRLTGLPVAFGLYNGALVVWHLPALYNAALEHHALHVVEHLTLIATAVLAWWPILSPDPVLPRPAYGTQLLYLFLMSVPMTVVAAFVTLAPAPLYPFYAAAPRVFQLSPLEDQRLGGVIMWVPAAMAPLAAFPGAVFADLGNDVICVDKDDEKIAALSAGRMPIYEPGLEEMVARNAADRRLAFTTDLGAAVPRSEIVFIAVGTPSKRDGETDLG